MHLADGVKFLNFSSINTYTRYTYITFAYHYSLRMAIRNSRNMLQQSPIYDDKQYLLGSL
jgi:hypothetical protein